MRMILALLGAAATLITWVNRRRLMTLGERLAIAQALRRVAERARVARAIEDEVAIMSDRALLKVAEEEDMFYGE